MREILFRGKRKVNNEWAEGFLFVDRKGLYKIKWYDPHYQSAKTSDVYPETVGQYTGLNDKNGVKIFEGDILGTNNRSSYIWIVDFKAAAFCANQGNCNFACELSEFMELTTEVEVIGNIHDNPELL